MALPFFYIDDYNGTEQEIVLSEETSKHIVQVLRMKEDELLKLTDGKGNLLTAAISVAHKKNCIVKINAVEKKAPPDRKITIAISLLKNTNRFEWFLEKATELGVSTIIPLLCERTEKEKFRTDRLQGIVISAMLQSQQVWLPGLQEPQEYDPIAGWKINDGQNFIAHCTDTIKQELSAARDRNSSSSLICIGSEGDFSPREIELAFQQGFVPVSLGNTRLRTETAGVVAATLLCVG